MRSLDLSGNALCAAGARALSTSNLPELQSFILSHTDIDNAGFSSIASLLKLLPNLTLLDLSHTQCQSYLSTGLIALSSELLSCPSLHTLNVGFNDTSPAAQHSFFSALALLPSLRVLDISNIHLERECDDFVAALRNPFLASSLECLNLSWNRIRHSQWPTLAPLLPTLTSVNKLGLQDMPISRELFSLLCPHLAQMLSLRSLNLSENPLGSVLGGHQDQNDATHMAHMLESLSSLQELDLHYCCFDSTDLIIILQSFPRLPSLSSLDLSGLFLDDSVIEPFLSALLPVSGLHLLRLHSDYYSFSQSGQTHLHSALMSAFPRLQHDLVTENDNLDDR